MSTNRQGAKCYSLLLISAELDEFHSHATPLGAMGSIDLN
jgi:hypothetical protein